MFIYYINGKQHVIIGGVLTTMDNIVNPNS